MREELSAVEVEGVSLVTCAFKFTPVGVVASHSPRPPCDFDFTPSQASPSCDFDFTHDFGFS